jgi:hypothetical protein
MKIRTNTHPQGSALVVTLLTAMVIGISLASYLTLVSGQNTTVMRSLAWNSTIPVLEAGVEEALTQLHYTGITNLPANGWSYYLGKYRKERMIGESSSFEVLITPSDPPVIESTGYARAPLAPSSYAGMILGNLTLLNPSSVIVSRSVRVNTRRDGMFTKGMVAKGQINMNGNNIQTDSFDSENALYSTGGRYDSMKARDHGDVATNSGLVNSLNVGNADIKGHVSTGPGGSVSIGSNGTVGDKAWVEGGNRGIQPGYVSDDMNVEFGSVGVPFTSGYSTPGGVTISNVAYTYVMGTGKYRLSSVDLSGQSKVLIMGDAVLYVTGDFSMTGQSFIQINPGASLKIYVGGASANLGGNGVINNTGSAANFYYYGLDNNTSLSLSGNAAFTGVIYAPNANFSLGGGGNNNYDFVGASVSKTVTMNGHYNFHYDEALSRIGPNRDYIVTAWNEI